MSSLQRIYYLLILLQVSFGSSGALSQEYFGYLRDVKSEREERFYEVYLFMTPAPREASLQETIFNRELSKEFRLKYHERFGQVDTDSIIYQKSNFAILEQSRYGNTTFVTETADRQRFAEYMMRRLTEWHVDNYFKNDPTMRPVYETKERLSKLEVAVAPDSKLNINYSLAENAFDIVYTNPYLDSKVIVNDEERLLQLGKSITSRVRINTYTRQNDGTNTLELVRIFRNNSLASISSSSYFTTTGLTPRETITRVGFSRSF